MTEPPRTTALPSRRGAMVILGLIAFGVLILGGLFLTPPAKAPPGPAGVPIGVPRRTLRFVCYDLARQHPANEPMIDAILALHPDYVLLHGVDEDDGVQIAEMLKMEGSFHPQLYQRLEHLAGRRGIWGNLILSRQSLYQGTPLGGPRGGYGALAKSIVDDRAFFVASIHLASSAQANSEAADLQQTWKNKGSPPLVAAVPLSDATPPQGLNFMNPVAGIQLSYQRIYVTGEWTVIASGLAPGSGKGTTPIWVDLGTSETGP